MTTAASDSLLLSSTESASSNCGSSSSFSSCESGVLSGNSICCSSLNINIATATTLAAASHSTTSLLTDMNQQSPSSSSLTTSAASIDTNETQITDTCSSLLLANTSSSLPFSTASILSSTSVTSPSSAQLLLNGIVSAGCGGVNNINNQNQMLSEDPRALKLAVELSRVGLNEAPVSSTTTTMQHIPNFHSHNHQHTSQSSQQQQAQFDINTLTVISAAVAAAASVNNSHNGNITNLASSNSINQFSTSAMIPSSAEDRSKKSQNMTECVPVPSSEHVAEIVGRQGCKIKALRAKTNTYIKTPVRGEEPVFVVTGRKEDVSKAKREILSAAEHFSLIRATRKPSFDGSLSSSTGLTYGGFGKTPPGPPSIPGQLTLQVRVPYRVVGLVVGPKGATIKHIQQETHTYIVTPSREKEPIFEVTGLPDNVQLARKQIEAHIALRTGNLPPGSNLSAIADAAATSVHTINSLSQILNEESGFIPEFLASLYKNGIGSAIDYVENSSESVAVPSSISTSSAGMSVNIDSYGSGTSTNHLFIDTISNCNNFHVQHNKISQNCDYMNTIMGNSSRMGVNVENIQNPNAQQLHNVHSTQAHIGNVMSSTNNLTATNNENTIISNSMNTNITRSCSSASSTTSSKSANNSGGSSSTNSSRPELMNIWKNLGDSLDIDEGIGESPSIWRLPPSLTALAGSHCSPSTSISPTDSLLGELSVANNGCNGLNHLMLSCESTIGSGDNNIILQQQQQQQIAANQPNINITGLRRECLVCSDKEVTAVLVPCGHNMFCMECANRICVGGDATCPVCSLTVYHAMRILA